MYELIFTPVDVIMFFGSGMALGFVLGAMVMNWTHKAPTPLQADADRDEAMRIIRELTGDR